MGRALQYQYTPWVIWRNIPFESAYINVNQDGIRRTPGADCVPGSYKVFAFGGSTMWGIGSPDWGTIAAYLQADLAKINNQPVCTINFGEVNYVSTQGVINFMTQIKKGNIPNLVIFYDGINDVYSGYDTGQACVHDNLKVIASLYNSQDVQPADHVVKLMQNSNTYQLVNRLFGNFTKANQKVINYRTMGVDTDSLAASIAQCYFGNYEIVGALAQKYGFEYDFFWQPMIAIGNKPLTNNEQDMRSSLDPALVDLYAATYRVVEQSAQEKKNFFYIANVFDDHRDEIWINFCHVTPVGDHIIAQEMVNKLGYPTGK
jgi:hypothetical protein